MDPREIDFKFGHGANFKDMETGEELITQPFQIQKAYREKLNEFTNTLKKECYAHNIEYQIINTEDMFDKALREFLAKRNRVQ